MEGELNKWTNYWNGWQPRWFVLNDAGILSYYKSKQEVEQGCKGSMNLGACDILVNPNDRTRIDISLKNEYSICLKCQDEKDRQKWLVALGSAKANATTASAAADPPADRAKRDSISPFFSSPSSPQPPGLGGGGGPPSATSPPPDASVVELLEKKKSDLKLYCDLLMQQTHALKTDCACAVESVMAKPVEVPEEEGSVASSPGLERLTEDASLLSKTCDTFICTLDDVMRLVSSAPTRRSVSRKVSLAGAPSPPPPHSPPNGFQSVFGGGGVAPPHNSNNDSSLR